MAEPTAVYPYQPLPLERTAAHLLTPSPRRENFVRLRLPANRLREYDDVTKPLRARHHCGRELLMKPSRTTTGFLLVVVMAFVGFLMLYLPQQVMAQYSLVNDAGSVWVIVYFSVVGTGAVILLGATVWILGRLLWRSRQKAARRERRDRNPSELSAEEKQREIDENLASVADYQDDAGDDQATCAANWNR